METNADCQGDSLRHEVVEAWTALRDEVDLRTLLRNTRSQICPQHAQTEIPIWHPPLEREEIVFNHEGAAGCCRPKRLEVMSVQRFKKEFQVPREEPSAYLGGQHHSDSWKDIEGAAVARERRKRTIPLEIACDQPGLDRARAHDPAGLG